MLPRSFEPAGPLPAAVLFDRDGTLVADVPYNANPDLMIPLPGARHLLDRLRAADVAVGVVTNQSGIGRGLITAAQWLVMEARLSELLGPFDVMLACPHRPMEGCACRKPAPGLVLESCRQLSISPADTVVVGDIGADVEAARRAGAFSVMVPTALTRTDEVEAAPCVVPDLAGVEDLLWRRR